MDRKYDDECDLLDSSVFTGQLVSDTENRNGFKEYLARWTREVEKWDRLNSECSSDSA